MQRQDQFIAFNFTFNWLEIIIYELQQKRLYCKFYYENFAGSGCGSVAICCKVTTGHKKEHESEGGNVRSLTERKQNKAKDINVATPQFAF